ncbi:lysosomal proton-coupled steroid conjugate and bile acid symporter SLC46A3 isoform X1 [Hypanus sabinus]|uniref:lysosomal proton-coupled steroid conjugate and bile acid symporter SLC46A3 isoform X1 n=1 Tax=Hypanus sabinus TaxID=79690 RepID=UPI0028C49648|nr:lysosomal proton-coupled steroid conjugate and bile acid symporter SLC46A3 isoform X1 [Hypanus sabinus]
MDLRTIVTVEPVVFLFLMSTYLSSFAIQQLVLVKICEELHFEKDVCSNFSHNLQDSLVIQSQASYVMLLYTAVLTFLSIPTSILLGAWSDHGGRKLGMILPSVGSLIGGIILIVMVCVKEMSVYWCVLASAMIAIFGNYPVIFLSVFSYISDTTTVENRTKFISIVEAMVYIGGTVGFLLSGWLLQRFTLIYVFGVYCGCQVLTICYVLLWLKESNHSSEWSDLAGETPPNSRDRTLKNSLLLYASKTWKTFSKERDGQDRLKLYLIFICGMLMSVCNTGEQSILILFLTHPPHHFSPELYGVYNAMKMFLGGIILIGIFPFLLRCIKEMTLAKLGALVRVISLILLSLSTNTWMAFLSAVMNSFSGFLGPILRSVASTVVEQNEQGAMFSCMASIETVCVIIGASAFYTLYPETLTTLPGFPFLVMAGFQVVILILVQ